MTAKLFETALGVGEPWHVAGVDFDEAKRALTILVDFTAGSRFPHPDAESLHGVHDTDTKRYRHLNFFQHECYLEFCSATVSRKMMEPDPRNIVFCPYIIAVYVLPQEPKKVYVSLRKPDRVGTAKSKEALKAVEKLLDEIIRDALQ